MEVGEYKEKDQGLTKGNELVEGYVTLEETEEQDYRSRTMNLTPADLSDLMCCHPHHWPSTPATLASLFRNNTWLTFPPVLCTSLCLEGSTA